MSVFNGLVQKAGGISVSGIALILPAAHKCASDWPASHAKNTCYPSTGCYQKPSSERKVARERVTEGACVTLEFDRF